MNEKFLEIFNFCADPESYVFSAGPHEKRDSLIMEDKGMRARELMRKLYSNE